MSATRDDVVREARGWVGTPFHHCADVKGLRGGVDCAMLNVRAFCGLGLVEPFDPRPYDPEWFLHGDRNIYLEWCERYARQVDAALVRPGDVVVLNFGLFPAHGAIITGPHSMVHAYMPARRVIEDFRSGLWHRVHSAWSVFPEGA